MKQPTDKNIEWYISSFETFERGLNGESKLPIHVLRKAAMARFVELGFPTSKHEEWRFTNLVPLTKIQFKPAILHSPGILTRGAMEQFTFGGARCSRLVFEDGHFVNELSSLAHLPLGAKVMSLASAVKSDGDVLYQHLGKHVKGDENGFTALNTGFMQNGAFVYIPDGVVVEEPIHLLFVSTGGEPSFISTPRNLIIAGKNSQVSIVESYVSLAGVPYLTNTVTEMIAGERSLIEHDKLQDESLHAFHVGTTHFQQSAGSNVVSNSIALGGSIVRNNVTSVLAGEGIECTLNGLSLATGQQLVDNHTAIDHAKPNFPN